VSPTRTHVLAYIYMCAGARAKKYTHICMHTVGTHLLVRSVAARPHGAEFVAALLAKVVKRTHQHHLGLARLYGLSGGEGGGGIYIYIYGERRGEEGKEEGGGEEGRRGGGEEGRRGGCECGT